MVAFILCGRVFCKVLIIMDLLESVTKEVGEVVLGEEEGGDMQVEGNRSKESKRGVGVTATASTSAAGVTLFRVCSVVLHLKSWRNW